jgi:hypothetical protein
MNNPVGRPRGSFKHSHPTRIDGKVTKAYSAWQAMVQRCHNPKAHNYAWYGARGIRVCERWRDDYSAFVDDVGVPQPGLSLERMDNSKGYEPGNCRWATMAEQAKNRRKGKQPDHNSLRSKAKQHGLAYHVVYQRIKLLGWSEWKALHTPVQQVGKYLRS